jgi:3D (Asp-Asp-Asp) domain-containing protein/uncharacterized coiled-coil protein SlyX
MKPLKYTIAIILMLAITFTVFIWQQNQTIKGLKSQMQSRDKTITSLKSQLAESDKEIAETDKALEELFKQLDDLFKTIDDSIIITDTKVSRGNTDVRRMRVTAYDLSYESCGKLPDHPKYGITASGERVKEWYTVASGPELLFGTKVYIPFFRDYPNKGIFVVKDRGSMVKENCIDVYIADNKACWDFGLRYLDVYVLENENEEPKEDENDFEMAYRDYEVIEIGGLEFYKDR